jgi:hypothetical protein
MASLLTPGQYAREILAIFLSNLCRPNDVLLMNNIQYGWGKSGLIAEDFDKGFEFAVKNGWVELINESHAALKLTDEGFRQAKKRKKGR